MRSLAIYGRAALCVGAYEGRQLAQIVITRRGEADARDEAFVAGDG